MLGSKAVRAAAKLWYVAMLRERQALPVPRDAQRVSTGDVDPDRVLLIGNGATHGWGTITHELALTGQLARALTRRTSRETEVEYVGDELMNLAAVIPWIGDRRLDRYDLVLVVMSMNDALRLTPLDEYRAEMGRLLDLVATSTRSAARVVIAGIHRVDVVPRYRGLPGRIAQCHADDLNAAVRELVGRYDGVRFLDLQAPHAEPMRPAGSPGMYAEWSQVFAEPAGTALDEVRALEPERRPAAPDDRGWDWAPAAHVVDGAPQGGWDGLDRIVTSARSSLGADVAHISLIDGGRQYFVATTAPTGRSVPLELSHCSVTIEGDEPVVIGNALKDPRLRTSPFIDVTQMRSYSGVPLKNAAGENIGTFCVLSAVPGRTVPEDRLLAYAARAQEELQRIAADGPADRATDDAGLRTDASAS